MMPRPTSWRSFALLLACVLPGLTLPWNLQATDLPGATAPVSFHRQVRPILQAHCVGCHQPAKPQGGYVMTGHRLLLTPGDSDEAPVVPGQPADSLLLRQITPVNGVAEMPRGKPPLHPLEIATVQRWIAEGAHDDSPPEASSWDMEHPPRYSRPPVVTALDFSPDGQFLAVAGFHEVLLHRADGSEIVARFVGLSERIQSIRFSPDGRWLAVAGGQPARMGEIQIWDVVLRQLRTSVAVGHDTVYGVDWSPDSQWVSFGCPDKTVRAIEATSGRQILQQMAHEDWVLGTAFSKDGSHVISVGRDQSAKLTEVASQRFIDNITSITPGALRGGLQAVARHPTRDEVLVGGADGQPQIYQVFRQAARKIGDNAALLRVFHPVEGRIFGVAYHPTGDFIAAAASLDSHGAVHLYSARFDPTLPPALLKAYEKTSGEYTTEEREAIRTFTTADVALAHRIPVSSAPVYAVRFSPDGQRLAAGTGTGVILLIDVASGVLTTVFAAAPLDDPTPADAAHPLLADASAPEAGHATSPEPLSESHPPDAEIVALVVQPNAVHLPSRNDRVQLLVTARLESGDEIDVTRVVSFEPNHPPGHRLEISPTGRVTAHPDTARPDAASASHPPGSIAIRLGNLSVTLPVAIDWAHQGFEADFIRDVNPVLALLGCSAGTCHGAQDGKNGFKLSLRGYDPVFDVRAIADDLAARRVNRASPDESLLLLKATATVPHEGGQRTPAGSRDYAILRQWIADGARLDLDTPRVTSIALHPENPVIPLEGARQQFRVVATYADGRTRDVTAESFIESGNADVAGTEGGGLITAHRRGEAPILARYEGNYAATTVTVMGDRSGFEWVEPPVHNRIDELVAAKWRRLKIQPSDLCTDAEFIRRVSLDLTGLPPTADQVSQFLDNPRDRRSKREALIERLLHSPEFADHWANKWSDLLMVNRKFLGEEGARLFRNWIRDAIASNTPYDRFVHELLTASGSNREQPAASFWKIQRDPAEAMESTTHLFLATRFNCNKCHDHPFERWTQDQYFELAQFFARIDRSKDPASGDRRVGGSAVEGSTPLFEIIDDRPDGGVPHERTRQPVAPAFPFTVASVAPDPDASLRRQLADWLTAPDNRYFALSYVNRLWGYLMGVGLIEPLDDIRAGNPPSNPELLEHLTREFIETGFDTRHILRQICRSRTYQLSIEPNPWNADDTLNYSRALPRRLPAEVLLDAVYQVTGAIPNFPGATPGVRAAQLVDAAVDVPSGFLANLGRPARESACECERSNDLQLSAIMALLSGPAVSEAVHDPDNALARLAREEADDQRLAERLFLRILNRPATPDELAAVARHTAALEHEHARLEASLAEAEAAWASRHPLLERQRLESMARAENTLAAHLVERASKVAAAQRERHERIAAAEAAVQTTLPALQSHLPDWESALPPERRVTRWTPLDPKSFQVGGSARLQKLPDGSIRSTASVGELPNYVVTAETALAGITGFRLEVLPDAHLPNFGPGHKDGDFILAEILVDTASRSNANAFTRARLADAAASTAAPGLDVRQTFNGIREQGRRDGWGIGTETGRPHWAAFAFDQPVGDTNGTVFRVTLVHAYEAPHEVGRFRLWVTTDSQPTLEGLPAEIAAILDVPAHRRPPAQTDRLLAYLRAQDPALLERDFRLELARQPLPPDLRLQELEQDLARASRPVPVDPALLQLRQDVALSARQLRDRRLTAVQDVAWALINTPAFLFNH